MPVITSLTALADRFGRHMLLDAADRTALLRLPHSIRSYEPSQYVLREGDRPRYCSIILSGMAFRHKIVADGGRQIVSIHMAADIVDLQNLLLDYSDHSIQALTQLDLVLIERDLVCELAFAKPAIGKALWRDSLIEASILREWVANVGRRDARARTAHVLCEIAVRQEAAGFGARETFELPMTQEQLGDVLGLTPVHVNRTLKTLQDEGLIRRSKRSVLVMDWKRLRDAGDFTSGYLHLDEPVAAIKPVVI